MKYYKFAILASCCVFPFYIPAFTEITKPFFYKSTRLFRFSLSLKRKLILIGMLLGSFLFTNMAFCQNQFNNTGSGQWSDSSIWFCYTCTNGPDIPNGSSDRATVLNDVNLDINATVQNLTVISGGNLTASGTSLSVGPDPSDPQALADFGSISLSSKASINVNGAMEAISSDKTVTLSLAGGSTLSDSGALIGSFPPASAAVQITVTGPGSEWDTTGMLFLANGTLNIQAGGLVTDVNGNLGASGSGAVTVTVDGTGSAWNSSSVLFVGGGNGKLTVQNGGTVNSDGGNIGSGSGNKGVMAVTGSGSAWFDSGFLDVGDNGLGTLNIQQGGTVKNQDAIIATTAGAPVSSVTVDGTGSTWTTEGDLKVGESGNGTMTISSGGTASSNTGVIGSETGSNGTVTVKGSGSVWNVAGDITVGEKGTGTLNIQNGGVVNSGNLVSGSEAVLGEQAKSSGTATIDGSGSQWNITGDLTVGGKGGGGLIISNGGYVNDGSATIGEEDTSISAAFVDGSNSVWANSGDLTVGDKGTGGLDITNSGDVTDVTGTVGGEKDSQGTVDVEGSRWNNSGSLTLGDKGSGTLNGTHAVITSTEGSIGDGLNSTGKVTLDNSTWTMTGGDLTVGGEGNGTVNLTGKTTITVQDATIGEADTGSGGVTVASGSTWTNSGDLTVADKGHGTLGVLQDGKVADAAGDVGGELNSRGAVTVAGLWQNSKDLTIGDNGSGTMTINGSGSVTNTDGDIASNLSADGKVTVQGDGSNQSIPTWYNNGSLKVGDGGTGELNVLNGGQVYSESGAIGGAQGSKGTVMIDGQGSKWVANEPGDTGDLNIGTDQGTGKLTVSNEGVVTANNIEVGANGTLDGVNGTIMGNLIVDSGGVVSPGDPGPMSIIGDVDLTSGSTLILEIASFSDYDSLDITGNGIFDGIISLDFINGFAPSSGDNFAFITDSGEFSWNPSSIDFIGITPGAYGIDLSNGFRLTATSDWNGESLSTPEPSTFVLLGTGLLGIAVFFRRRV